MIDKLYGFQVSVYPVGELIVYDLTDPDDIIIKYRFPLDYLLMGSCGIIAKDGYLYVAGGSGGGSLYTFDISDIDNIALVDTYHDDARLINGGGMCIRGNYLYISRLTVTPAITGYITRFHLDNKAHPTLSNVSSIPGISGISTYGDLLYTTRWSLTSALNGLFIYDHDYVLQDSLTGAGSPNYMGLALGGVREGDYSYVISYAEGRLNIINVADPTNIALASTLLITPPPTEHLLGVLKDGDYCYIPDTLGNLYVVDVSNPGSPSLVGTLGGFTNPGLVAKYEDYCYIIQLIDPTLSIVDVSDPDTPSVAGELNGGGYGGIVVIFYPAPVPYSFEEIGTGVSTGGEIEGYMTVLNDDRIVGLLELPPMAVEDIIELLLDYSSAHVAGTLLLGGVDTALNKTLEMTFQNKTILKCITDIVKIVGGYLTVRHDPNDPHVRYLYLEELEDDLGQEVRIGKNLKSIKKSADYSELCTRMVPLGDGEGVDQLNLTMLNVVNEVATHLSPDAVYGYIQLGGTYRCYNGWTGDGDALPSHVSVSAGSWLQGSDPRMLKIAIGSYNPATTYTVSYQHAYYLIADTYDTYGQITKDYAVKGITTVDDLIIAGVTELTRRSVPKVAYTIGAIDLSELIGREAEKLEIGSLAHAIDEGLSINVAVPVMAIKKRSLREPSDTDFTFSNFPLSIADRLANQQESIDAINNQSVTGTSTVIPYTASILIGHEATHHPKNFKFEISDTFIRCNKVGLTWLEDEDVPDESGSETIDFDVTVDGHLIGHAISMSDFDITSYLTTPILGTEHKITWEFHTLPGTNACYLHVTVNAQVFRRSKPLF